MKNFFSLVLLLWGIFFSNVLLGMQELQKVTLQFKDDGEKSGKLTKYRILLL